MFFESLLVVVYKKQHQTFNENSLRRVFLFCIVFGMLFVDLYKKQQKTFKKP